MIPNKVLSRGSALASGGSLAMLVAVGGMAGGMYNEPNGTRMGLVKWTAPNGEKVDAVEALEGLGCWQLANAWKDMQLMYCGACVMAGAAALAAVASLRGGLGAYMKTKVALNLMAAVFLTAFIHDVAAVYTSHYTCSATSRGTLLISATYHTGPCIYLASTAFILTCVSTVVTLYLRATAPAQVALSPASPLPSTDPEEPAKPACPAPPSPTSSDTAPNFVRNPSFKPL